MKVNRNGRGADETEWRARMISSQAMSCEQMRPSRALMPAQKSDPLQRIQVGRPKMIFRIAVLPDPIEGSLEGLGTSEIFLIGPKARASPIGTSLFVIAASVCSNDPDMRIALAIGRYWSIR